MCEPPKPTCSFPQDPAIVQVRLHTTPECSFVLKELEVISLLSPQSSMGTGSASSAAASTQFQSGGSYGLFNRAPVPPYNQFGSGPLVSPQFGAVGVGE